jgi:hypothetical protein
MRVSFCIGTVAKSHARTSDMTKVINAECDNRIQELTEELAKVTGGSQSTGAGAGKAKFNDFHITKHTDSASPGFF